MTEPRFLSTLKQQISDYFALTGFLVSQQEAEQSIREGVSFRGTNTLILIFAILIASLGLNTNSTAVIIGAMLISPLMGPIIGIGLGVGIQDFALIRRSIRNLSIAATLSVLASCIYFLISPVSQGHSELLARTSPTIYDVLIGFFGGFAGIIGVASKSKGNVIPGVAIATALMPPLCTAGYGLATWQGQYFFGAFYLFLINSIYIALATFIGVKLMRYTKVSEVNPRRSQRIRRIVYSLSILTLIPSVVLTYRMYQTERFVQNADRFVADECRFAQTQVLTHKAVNDHGQRVISLTLIGKVLPQDSLVMALSSRLSYYGLQGVKLQVLQGESGSLGDVRTQDSSVKDIFEMAQTAISRKQATIDSLRTILDTRQSTDSAGASIAPELKVVFPQVADIAVTKAVFSDIRSDGRLDTLNVALVRFSQPVNQATRQRLERYLEARLEVKSISLVTVNAPL